MHQAPPPTCERHALWSDNAEADSGQSSSSPPASNSHAERGLAPPWTIEQELYAQDFLFKCSKRLVLHQTAFYYFQRRHYGISFTSHILGALVSTVAFSNVSQNVLCGDFSWAMLAIGIMSALAMILGGFSAHVVDYKQEMNKHEVAYLDFQQLVRELSAELYAPGMRRPYRITMRRAIRSYNRYTNDAKILPSRVNDTVNKRLRADTEYENAAAAAAAADHDRWRAQAHLVQMSPDVDYMPMATAASSRLETQTRAVDQQQATAEATAATPATSSAQTSGTSSGSSEHETVGNSRRGSLLGALFARGGSSSERSPPRELGPLASAMRTAQATGTYRGEPSIHTRYAERRCTLQSAKLPASVQFELYMPSYFMHRSNALMLDTPGSPSSSSSSPLYPRPQPPVSPLGGQTTAPPWPFSPHVHQPSPPPSPPPPPLPPMKLSGHRAVEIQDDDDDDEASDDGASDDDDDNNG